MTILRTGSPSARTPVSFARVSSICRYHLRRWNSPKLFVRIGCLSALEEASLVDRAWVGPDGRLERRPCDSGDLRERSPFLEPACATVDRPKEVAVLRAGKEEGRIGGVHAERPESGV